MGSNSTIVIRPPKGGAKPKIKELYYTGGYVSIARWQHESNQRQSVCPCSLLFVLLLVLACHFYYHLAML